MPSLEEPEKEQPEKERDQLFNAIAKVVLLEDMDSQEKQKVRENIQMMLVIFRQRLYSNLCGGVILDGKPWEDRLEKQVIQEYRFPKNKKPLVVDILRAVVNEKIESDKKMRSVSSE